MSKLVAVRRLASVGLCALGGFLTAGCQSNYVDKTVESPRPVTAEVCRPAETVAFMSAQPMPEPTGPAVSREDVLAWSLRGIQQDVIIDRLERSGSQFHLTTTDEIHLKDAGVAEDVIRVMKSRHGMQEKSE